MVSIIKEEWSFLVDSCQELFMANSMAAKC